MFRSGNASCEKRNTNQTLQNRYVRLRYARTFAKCNSRIKVVPLCFFDTKRLIRVYETSYRKK